MRKDIRELLDKMADMFMEEPALEKPKKYTIYVAHTYDDEAEDSGKVLAVIPRHYDTLEQAIRDSDSYNTWLDDNFIVSTDNLHEAVYTYVAPLFGGMNSN